MTGLSSGVAPYVPTLFELPFSFVHDVNSGIRGGMP